MVDNDDFSHLFRHYKGEDPAQEADEIANLAPATAANKIKYVCVGQESLDVDITDFENLMRVYHCEEYMDHFTQRLMPPKGDDKWSFLVIGDEKIEWCTPVEVFRQPPPL